jgi:GT2 family glycosyltransferase
VKGAATYEDLWIGKTPERELFLRVPWMLDAFRQDLEQLERAVRMEAARFSEWSNPPLISIITPMYNTAPNLLAELIASVRLQSYPYWELLLRDDASSCREHIPIARQAAAGDRRIRLIEDSVNRGIGGGRDLLMQEACGSYFVILDHDDLLHPQALGLVARALIADDGTNFVYTNEAKIDEDGVKVFDFISKPSFDYFTLLRNNYICHLSCFSRDLVDALRARDGVAWNIDLDGAEDHDFFLRLASLPGFKPTHIPLFPYYWRAVIGSTALNPKAKEKLNERREQFLRQRLDALYGCRRYELRHSGELGSNSYISIFPRLDSALIGGILVIVPFHNAAKMTIACLDRLLTQDARTAMKVVLVDNNSSEQEVALVRSWIVAHPTLTCVLERYEGAFNFAKINNFAFSKHASGLDYVLFLNNDVEIVSHEAASTMAAHLHAHTECAFVGIRLMYPGNAEVQHGGIRVIHGTHGSGYVNIGHANSATEFVYDERVSMGVTFACAMARCETFRELGGLEETLLPNGFGDIDIVLRARARGKVSHYFGTLMGLHHESKTRKRASEEVEFAFLHKRHASAIAESRLRELCFDWQPRLASAGWRGSSEIEKPLRYRIVDWVNNAVKRFVGPLHRGVKTFLQALLVERKK